MTHFDVGGKLEKKTNLRSHELVDEFLALHRLDGRAGSGNKKIYKMNTIEL